MTRYKQILQTVAKEYGTTPNEVEREIKDAITASGMDLSPQAFIAICSAKAKADIANHNL